MFNREVSQDIRKQRGIIIGSPFAPCEVATHLDGLIDIARAWNLKQESAGSDIRVVLSVHADDMSVCLSGTNRKQLVQAAGRLAMKLAQHIDELGMKLGLVHMSCVLVFDEELLRASKKVMVVLAGSEVHSVRKLGVG